MTKGYRKIEDEWYVVELEPFKPGDIYLNDNEDIVIVGFNGIHTVEEN